MPDYEPSSFPDIPIQTAGAWSPDHIAADYDAYALVIDYQTDEGILQAPVAGPVGTPARFVRTHAPVGRVVVTWTARRNGRWPTVPQYRPPQGSAFVPLRRSVAPSPPVLDPTGTVRIYTLQGRYEYGLKSPIEELRSSYPVGKFPFDSTPYAAYVLGPENFSAALYGFEA